MPFPIKKIAIILLFAILFTPFGVFALSSSGSTVLNVSVNNPECRDTLDNDGDSFIDFPADPGCSSLDDNNESSIQCADGIDNDGDSAIDFPADVGCTDASDNDETNAVGGGGGDTTPPAVTLLSPADNAVNVSTTTNLIVDFTESVTMQTGNIRIKKTSDGSTVQTIPVPSGQVVLSPNSRLTITPATPLLEGVSYYVELDSGIVSDTAGNAFAGLSGASAWNFTTIADVVPPQILNLTATPGTTSANLSWATNESAISSFAWGTTTGYASGSGAEVFYSLNHTTALSGLLPGTLYYYSIEARDASGNKSTATSSFVTLSTIDTTPPANPSGFTATAGASSIELSWTNPTDPDFSAVKIMKSTTGYPGNPSEGTLVYQGSAEAVSDTSVSVDIRYYYTIFARDASLNYSSGAVASAIINSNPLVVSPPELPIPPIVTGGTGGSTSTSSPIVTPSITPGLIPKVGTSTPPIVAPHLSLFFTDFSFYEQNLSTPGVQEKKIIPEDNEVLIGEKNELKISLSLDKVPLGGKLFIASIKDPATGKVSSYLLNKNKLGTGYEAVVSSVQKGVYPINIKVYDAYNELLGDVSGTIRVFAPPPSFLSFLPASLAENISPSVEAVAPVAVPVGVAIGVSQAVVLAANVTSFYDLYLLFLKFIGLLTGLFRKKKPEPWGVVYDSVTKQPIDPAYVVVERIGEGEKKSAITDLDGRYGFLLFPGYYSLVANKTHYRFPSDNLAGKTHDELYDNLYFGSSFQVEGSQIVRYNIPLDPVEFDWNEFAKNKGKIFSLYSRRQKLRIWIFNVLFYAGLAIAVYGTLLRPTRFNELILVVYGTIIVFQALWRHRHKVTNLIDKATKQPIPFAIISITAPGVGVLIKKIVTDELGRFYLLVQPGVYDIAVQEKQLDGSYALVYMRKNVHLKKGVLSGDLIVGE